MPALTSESSGGDEPSRRRTRWPDGTVADDDDAVHILLADDDERTRRALRSMLLADGMEVIEAGDGRQALALADVGLAR